MFPSYDGVDGDGSPPPTLLQKIERVIDLIRLNVREHDSLGDAFQNHWGRERYNFHKKDNDSTSHHLDAFDAILHELSNKRVKGVGEWLLLKIVKELQKFNGTLYRIFANDLNAIRVVELSDYFLAAIAGLLSEIEEGGKTYEELDVEDFQDFVERHGAIPVSYTHLTLPTIYSV